MISGDSRVPTSSYHVAAYRKKSVMPGFIRSSHGYENLNPKSGTCEASKERTRCGQAMVKPQAWFKAERLSEEVIRR